MSNIKIAIDASRNRSGGAKAHLIGILSECDPGKYGIQEVHVWAFRALLDQLPDHPWLIKHNPLALEQSLYKQLLWQTTALTKEIKAAGCDILFTTDASTLCRFDPMVVLSQDMLSYEPGVMAYFGRRLFNINHSRGMYIVGFCFGLGFDTATEVALLGTAAVAVLQATTKALMRWRCVR